MFFLDCHNLISSNSFLGPKLYLAVSKSVNYYMVSVTVLLMSALVVCCIHDSLLYDVVIVITVCYTL